MAAPKPRISRWYVDSGGHRLGPFTLGQLQTEFRAGRVSAESPATPVNEAGAAEGEVTTVKRLLDQFLDPAVSLFETLRAAKDKRAPQKKHWSVPDATPPEPQSLFKKIPDQAWLFGGLAIVTGLLIMISITFIRESGRMLARSTTPAKPAPAATKVATPVKPAQARPAATSRPLITPVLPAPAPIARRPVFTPRPVAPPPVRRDDARDDRRDDRRDDPRDDRRDDRYERRDDLPMDRDIASPRGYDERNPQQGRQDDNRYADPRDARDPRDAVQNPGDPNDPRDNALTQ